MAIQLRRDTAANWTSANPVLAAGQPGFETDTRKWKVGDGTTAWNSLAYMGGTAAWADITGKPSTFPPSAHTHVIADVTGLQTALDDKAPTTHIGSGGAAHANASTSVAGFMSAADKTKLDGIAAGAQTGTVTSVGGTGTVSGLTLSGTVTTTGNLTLGGALDVPAGHITLARMANLAANSIIGNNTGSAAAPLALTAAQVRTLLNVADGATANATDAALRDRSTHTGTQAASTITGTLAVANGGTGVTTSTGTSSVVLSNSPTLVTPTLGAASATSIAAGLGAVGTPSYTFTGDLNTGIYSPAADTLAFVEGGVEAMRITSAGNVGVATTAPDTTFEVALSTTGLPGLRASRSGAQTQYIQMDIGGGASGRIFATGGNKAMFITNNNTGAALGTATDSTFIQVPGPTANTPITAIYLESSTANVGIGTTTPAGRLHAVNSYTNSSDATIIAGGNIPGINLRASGGGRFSILSNFGATNTTSLAAATGTSNPAEVMRIDHASGALIMGTGAPNDAAQLQVDSATRGFLPPRLTTTQRNGIATPPDGLMLYNSTANRLQVRSAGAWASVGHGISGTASVTIPDGAMEHEQTVTATGVAPGMVILTSLGPAAYTDENEPEMLDVDGLSALAGTDQITFNIAFATPQSGPVALNWSAA